MAFPASRARDDDQGFPVTHPLAGGEPFDPVAAGLALGRVFDVLNARVLVLEPRLTDKLGDLARAARLGPRRSITPGLLRILVEA